jgi:hypothetical protein
VARREEIDGPKFARFDSFFLVNGVTQMLVISRKLDEAFTIYDPAGVPLITV